MHGESLWLSSLGTGTPCFLRGREMDTSFLAVFSSAPKLFFTEFCSHFHFIFDLIAPLSTGLKIVIFLTQRRYESLVIGQTPLLSAFICNESFALLTILTFIWTFVNIASLNEFNILHRSVVRIKSVTEIFSSAIIFLNWRAFDRRLWGVWRLAAFWRQFYCHAHPRQLETNFTTVLPECAHTRLPRE